LNALIYIFSIRWKNDWNYNLSTFAMVLCIYRFLSTFFDYCE